MACPMPTWQTWERTDEQLRLHAADRRQLARSRPRGVAGRGQVRRRERRARLQPVQAAYAARIVAARTTDEATADPRTRGPATAALDRAHPEPRAVVTRRQRLPA